MSRLTWDEVGERRYETGTRKGVLFPMNDQGGYEKGVAWDGLTGVTRSPGGAEPNDVYADDMKYLTLMSAETLAYTTSLGNIFKGDWLIVVLINVKHHGFEF